MRFRTAASFKLNADDPRVPLLRKRLKIAGDETSTSYDQDVVDAVKKFQQGAGLSADGVAGPATLRALNGTACRSASAPPTSSSSTWIAGAGCRAISARTT